MLIIAIIGSIILYFVFAGPVLFRFTTGPMSADYGFIIFNPFRNHDPERCVDAFLELIRTGHCEDAMAELYDVEESRQETCEMERKHPVISWQLRNREDESQSSTLTFSYRRGDYEGEHQLFVKVEKRGEKWQVTNYTRAY